MTYEELEAVIRHNRKDTVIARAFRRAIGAPMPKARGRAFAKVDRFAGADRMMRQRYGVRM